MTRRILKVASVERTQGRRYRVSLNAFLLFLLGLVPTLAVAQPTDQVALASATEWSQWRGPERNGTSSAAPWPTSLDETRLRKLWTLPLGPSYSGPVVRGQRLFVTETIDKQEEQVTALDRDSGEILWRQKWNGAMTVPFFAAKNGSWIRATPTCDGETLYVGGMKDVLVALDVATGEIRWSVDFVAQNKVSLPAFGFVSSPLIDGDSLYVQAGGALCCLDKHTGRILWQSLQDGGGMNGSAFSSPTLANIGGERQLLVQTREKLAGVRVDGNPGQVLWEQEVAAFRGMNILTPTPVGDAVFTSSYGGKSVLFGVQRSADSWKVETRWENKLQGYMSSPVVHDGHCYIHLRNRRLACIRLADGAEMWVTQPYGEYWSMVAQGDKLLALDEQGVLYLIRMSPESFQLESERKVSDEPAWAHLANDRDQILIRDLSSISVYRWSD